MNKTIDRLKIYATCLCFLTLSACGGGGGGDSSAPSKAVDDDGSNAATALTGVVADGYLLNARVFLDRNNNHVYDNGEPQTVSVSGGQYSLAVNAGEGELYPVVVEVIAGQTVDEDNGLTVTRSYHLEAPAGRWQFVSPLTSLVKLECDKNPSLPEQQAQLNVTRRIGIADDVSVFADYLDRAGLEANIATEYNRTHNVARVVAELMGQLRTTITQNLGGQINAEEQRLIAYMISDQIMGQADLIKQALDRERNGGAVMDVDLAVNAVQAEIVPENLNADMLARYQQRVDQNFDEWDMQPPQLVGRSPAANSNTPIDIVVAVEFDELLDETLLNTDLVQLSGPHGLTTGYLEYDANQKQLVFVPDRPLLANSDYQITINHQLADLLGNPLGEEIIWTFSTIFDLTPPALPDF